MPRAPPLALNKAPRIAALFACSELALRGLMRSFPLSPPFSRRAGEERGEVCASCNINPGGEMMKIQQRLRRHLLRRRLRPEPGTSRPPMVADGRRRLHLFHPGSDGAHRPVLELPALHRLRLCAPSSESSRPITSCCVGGGTMCLNFTAQPVCIGTGAVSTSGPFWLGSWAWRAIRPSLASCLGWVRQCPPFFSHWLSTSFREGAVP